MYTASYPLRTTADALRTGELDLLRHIQETCDRIDAVEPHVQAFLPEARRRDRLRAAAQDRLGRYPEPGERPPLFGVLVGVKDIFRVDGFPTKAGSKLPPELFVGPETASVTRLKEAGALIAGKTVTTEFAYFQPGPTRNPHNPAHTPGGSSSGSAAGVAAGFFALALGTQTIGSVIRPAAFCGIVGLKPSFDRIPTAGLLYLSPSLDHVGLFTQDVEGMALAASVLCDDWDADTAQARPEKWPTLAVPEGPYLAQAEAEGRAAFEETLVQLEAAGVRVERVPFFDDFEELERRHRRLMSAEAARVHGEWFAAYGDRYSDHMRGIIEVGRRVGDEEMAAARKAQLALRQQMQDALAAVGADLWVAPAAPGPAPEGIGSTGNPIMNLPWTNAGVPALTLPAGVAANGLPLGLQLAAPFGQDEQLLAWGRVVAGMMG